MRIKHILKDIGIFMVILSSSLALMSCDNDENKEIVQEETQEHFTHEELAAEFVDKMSNDLGINLELLKINTLEFDYIVVEDLDLYDPVLGEYYTAYYIGDYDPGEDLSKYILDYDNDFHYPLTDNGDGTYTGANGFGKVASF